MKYNPFVTFSCPVLLCTVLFFPSSNTQLEPRGRYSRFMAQMTWLSPRTVLIGVKTMSDFLGWGNLPQKPPKGTRIGVFKPKSHNIKTYILSKLPHRFQPNFAQWWRPPNALHGWSEHAYDKSKMADSRHLGKISRQWSDRSSRNLARWRILALFTLLAVIPQNEQIVIALVT